MKFYIFKQDYESISRQKNNATCRLNEGTAVIRYKQWFFECIGEFGEIITLDENIEIKQLASFLNKPDAIFISVHCFLNNPRFNKVPRRMLRLALGAALYLPEELYTFKYLPSAQVNLLSTDFQIDRLKLMFSDLMPRMYSFPSNVDIDYFVPANKQQKKLARKKYGLKDRQIHLLYAGRLIITKGICQLIRVLDLWPMHNIVLTLAGNIEPDNKLAYSSADHKTFSDYLDNEILQKKRSWLRIISAKNKEDLRELFWSADLFVNPSVHPDENFGVTPREAASCGLPIVTTNFAGLCPLAQSMPWKGLDTYPTISGPRFSLIGLYHLLQVAIKDYKRYSPGDYRKSIINNCDHAIAKNNLKLAIEYLKTKPAEKPINTDVISKVKQRLLNVVDQRALELLLNPKQKLPAGSYVYGDGPFHPVFPIVQGLYSAVSAPPLVEKHTKWRGFFRISMWEQERALVEFGFPGLRIKRYSKKMWNTLGKCVGLTKSNDCQIIPRDAVQVSQVQELVDLGYLVSDD